MFKIVFCCRCKPETSLEGFHRYWLDKHGGCVESVRKALPSMTRHVQNHTEAGAMTDSLRASSGTDEPYDGVAEIWVEMTMEGDDPAATAMARLLEDENKFVDMARSSVFATEEHVNFG